MIKGLRLSLQVINFINIREQLMNPQDSSFRKFVADSKEKAALHMGSTNVGQELKNVLSNLLKIVEATENLMRSGEGQSADVRVLKAKFDQTKAELFKTKKELEGIKKELEGIKKEFMNALTDEVIIVSKEVKSIVKHASDNQNIQTSSKIILSSIKNMINSVLNVGSGTSGN